MDRDGELALFANDAFYAAFAGGDLAAMDEVWAERAPVTCIHPGAAPLFERGAIMDSWAEILGNAGVSAMTCHRPRLISRAPLVLVVCYETLGSGALIASNGFVQEGGRWRMVLHQAGPCQDAPAFGAESVGAGNAH